MVVHGLTGLLLHGLTGQDDILVGSPVANRRWPETEPLIGFFINTVLLRLRMPDDPTFRELVRRAARPPSVATPTRTSPSNAWSRPSGLDGSRTGIRSSRSTSGCRALRRIPRSCRI